MADELLRSKHVFGSIKNLMAAIQDGRVDAFDILFLTNEDNKPIIGWVDKELNPVFLEDEKGDCVIEVFELPSTGESGKLYVFEEDAYFWNGERYINVCKPTDVTELEASIKALEELVAKIAEETKAYTDEKVGEILDVTKNSYKAIKYEFTDVPNGTIVDYREDEIRIMCPSNAVFTKQAVGSGGDVNSYYGTLKTYAPENAVGYIEHLGDQVDKDILADLKTDKYGRKYQPTWLALAKYDETADNWTYYGANSSKDKYIGWDYQIDWYNEDNVMIASDCIRINLSNEECHFTIEPYYMAGVTSSAINTAKVYTDEQIQTIMNMFTIVEI